MEKDANKEIYKPTAKETKIQVVKFVLFSISAGIIESGKMVLSGPLSSLFDSAHIARRIRIVLAGSAETALGVLKRDPKVSSIAIDGPVGAGKSTVADEVARRLGILHLDTGAMYRAVGLAVVAAGIDVQDEAAVTALCEKGGAHVDVRYENGAQVTLVNGRDVTGSLRSQEAGTAASAVSRYAAVRRMLVKRQQELAREQPMLLDGRDIGTVVLKDATVKVYLTASPEARAQRRLNQLREKGQDADFGAILHEVNARDHQDMTRAVDPLRQAEDAVVVDSSDLNFEETVQAILRLVEAANG